MNNALAKARLKGTEIPIGAHEVQKNSFEIERPMQHLELYCLRTGFQSDRNISLFSRGLKV
jgi:hypothetical protein